MRRMLQSCVVAAAAVEDVPGAVRLRRAVAMWHRQTCAVWATAAHDSTPESILTVRTRSVNQPPGTTSSHLLREIPVLPIYFWTPLPCTGSTKAFRRFCIIGSKHFPSWSLGCQWVSKGPWRSSSGLPSTHTIVVQDFDAACQFTSATWWVPCHGPNWSGSLCFNLLKSYSRFCNQVSSK